MPEESTIVVAPGPKLKPGQVAIWERNTGEWEGEGEKAQFIPGGHPNGEVFLAAPHPGEEPQTIRVVRTGEVSKRLSDGRLVEVTGRTQSRFAQPAPIVPAQSPEDARLERIRAEVRAEVMEARAREQIRKEIEAELDRDNATPGATADAIDSHGEVMPGLTVAQRDALVAAGFETVEDIRAATDEQLLAVHGIGPQTVASIREAVGE